jgi:hypothetical protein
MNRCRLGGRPGGQPVPAVWSDIAKPRAEIPMAGLKSGPRAAVAQLARASACHAEGRGFESHQPLCAPLSGGAFSSLRLICPAPWRSGYAAACKAVYTGSIPVGASRTDKPDPALQSGKRRVRPALDSPVGADNPRLFRCRTGEHWRTKIHHAAPGLASAPAGSCNGPPRYRCRGIGEGVELLVIYSRSPAASRAFSGTRSVNSALD